MPTIATQTENMLMSETFDVGTQTYGGDFHIDQVLSAYAVVFEEKLSKMQQRGALEREKLKQRIENAALEREEVLKQRIENAALEREEILKQSIDGLVKDYQYAISLISTERQRNENAAEELKQRIDGLAKDFQRLNSTERQRGDRCQ